MRAALCFLALSLVGTGCARPGGPYPSLQPRAAERIDPRLPVERPINDRPVAPALAARLAELTAQARGGEAAFDRAIAAAESLAAASGPPRSESWIAAQEALSAAIAARAPVARALGDIDSIGAEALQRQGGIAPNDLAAIRAAAEAVGSIDRRQVQRVSAVQRRLGL